MECEDYKEQASLFIDSALEAAKQPGLFRHLAECSDCQSFVQASLRVRQTAAEEEISVPAQVDEEMLSSLGSRQAWRGPIEPAQRRVSFSLWHRRLAIPFPAVALALLLILLLATGLSVSAFRGQDHTPGINVITARGEATVPPGSVVVIYALPEEEVIGRPVRTGQRIERTY